MAQHRTDEIARALIAGPALLLLNDHNVDFVMCLFDRLVVMNLSEKLAEGQPEQVQRDPAVLHACLGGID